MTFSELAKELRPFYAGEMTVPEFTKELLLQITDYREAVLKYNNKKETKERSEKTFTSYYDGTKMITPIAKRIAVNDHLKPDKFLTFLKRHEFDNIKKEEMCKAFEKHFPNKKLNIDNIFNTIVDEYESIIKSSVSNSDKQQAKPPVDNNDIEEVNIPETIKAVGTNPVETFMIELKAVIRNLKNTGHKIASRVQNQMTYKSPFGVVDLDLKKSFSKRHTLYPQLESEFNKLQDLYDSMEQYNTERNDDFPAEVLKLIANIKIESFIETREEAAICSFENQYIFDLSHLIQNYFEGGDI